MLLDLIDYVIIVKLILVVIVMLSSLAFLYWAPWTFGIPMSNQQHGNRFLFESWKIG